MCPISMPRKPLRRWVAEEKLQFSSIYSPFSALWLLSATTSWFTFQTCKVPFNYVCNYVDMSGSLTPFANPSARNMKALSGTRKGSLVMLKSWEEILRHSRKLPFRLFIFTFFLVSVTKSIHSIFVHPKTILDTKYQENRTSQKVIWCVYPFFGSYVL